MGVCGCVGGRCGMCCVFVGRGVFVLGKKSSMFGCVGLEGAC